MRQRDSTHALQIKLFGPPSLRLADGRELALAGRAAALLALVALEPGIRRQRVAAMLWPESGDARRNLRQQLLRLRQLLGAALIEGDEALSLASGVQLDEAAPGAELLGDETAGNDEFGQWLARQREQTRRLRQAPLREALAMAEATGDLETALLHAQALLQIDPHDEAPYLALMRLHYLRGEPAAGLATFARLGEMLAARYHSRPSDASAQLADTLRRSGQRQNPDSTPQTLPAARLALGEEPRPGAIGAGRALPVTLKRPPVLVGRSAELAAALQAWSAARVLWIEGDAGLGKSRLIAEMLARVAEAQAAQAAQSAHPGAEAGAPRLSVLSAAGRPGDRGVPYTTLARLLRPLLLGGAAPLGGPAHDALACIAPGPVDGAGAAALAPVGASAGALRPGALQAAVAELLARSGVRAVALDDLHFADDATLDLVAALAAPEPSPVRWMLALRPAEIGGAAQSLRDVLVETHRLSAVVLAPLDGHATAELVDSLAIAGLHGETLATVLVRHTGGNPLYLLETIKQGLVDGSLARGDLPRPASVGALIDHRLLQLSDAALALARVAAIAGVDFSVELAETIIGRPAVHLAGSWRELQDAQVLRDEAFAHDLVCDAVLRGVPQVVARRVHAQCAAWLAQRGGEPARVAWHWQHGGKPTEAGRAFVLAARRAELASRGHEEAQLYGHAAACFAAAGLQGERFDALCDRAAALVGADFGELALEETQALAAAATSDAQRLRAHRELAGLLTERSQLAEAIEEGQAGLVLARRLGDHEAQVRVVCHMATALCRMGRADEAHALLLPLRPWVDAQDDERLRMLWHGDWASTLGHLGRLREAVVAYDPALAAVRRMGWRAAEGRLMLNFAVTLRQMGQFDRALALSRQGRAQVAEDTGTSTSTDLQIAALVLARDESEAGVYAPALAALEVLLPQFEAAGTGFWWQACRMVLVQLWMHLGQYARSLVLLGDEPHGMPPWLSADRQLLRLELAQVMGQPLPDDAPNSALALANADAQRGPGLRVRALRCMKPAQVREQAARLSGELARKERFGAVLALQVHVARAALAQGQVAAAADAARDALRLFDEGYAPESMYRAEAWLVAWRALAAAGARDEAGRALQAGADWIGRHALPGVPAAFIDSFLHRNPVNRELLAAAAALPP